MKKLLLFALFFIPFSIQASINLVYIPVDGGNFKENLSLGKNASVFEDKNRTITIDSLLLFPDNYQFKNTNSDNLNIGFTSSNYWLKINLKSSSDFPEYFFLETAKPVTNLAELYFPDKQGNYWMKVSGDDRNFDKKDVLHRSTLFSLPLYPNNEATIYIKLFTDGEVLSLPLKLWKPEGLRLKDYHEQYIFGFFYGVLFFVVLIFMFFYFALKENSFLYYVLFVISVGLLQFSLDGYTMQFITPYSPWLGHRLVPLTACLSLIFVLLHAKVYLDTKHNLPVFNKIFNGFILVALIIASVSFTRGFLYTMIFPVINVIVLFSNLTVIAAVVLALKKKVKVNLFYLTAFVFLMLGAITFISGNVNLIENNHYIENALKFGSGIQVIFLSFAMAGRYRSLQMEKENAQAATLEKLEEMNKLKDSVNIELEKQVKERTFEINQQKEEIENKNKDITDSINYAKRIQKAILPEESKLKAYFADSFILFKPKDIVSGDFYWFNSCNHLDQQKFIVAAADCTGHGVPGAFLSMIGNSFLNQIVNEKNISVPSEILEHLRKGIIYALKQKGEQGENKDGMDIALISIDTKKMILNFSGAQNPLYLIRNNLVEQIKGDKFPIGVYPGSELNAFTNNEIGLQKGDLVYIFTDGYADQFGGPKGKKFKYKQLQELLLSMQDKAMEEQKELLDNTFEMYRGELNQVDDILIIGIRI
ncbi:MAG: SpoIIE family protein phosphatase [Bacteroidetes bacterium]|nr:SpoIIE family protein phosphatase [Bacteroidota bacterium]HET6244060.1 7TM diverse intracellular signaling domain-containing protein [Bacteroidia bacterium]